MPVAIERPGPVVTSLRERRLRRGAYRDRGRRLTIALVNNMPDAAVFSTQRQFIRLLEDAAGEHEVALGFLTLASILRGQETRREMGELYRLAAEIGAPDAVIVTGAEPQAASFEAEPYWRELTALFDAARARAHATLASCLAAHAWVWHRHRIARRRVASKYSGLYAAELAVPHVLTRGLGPGVVPHSRWNGLDEDDLVAAGYVTLTRVGGAGVDMFVHDEDHLALFFQGHPEYDADTLAREYRRDVGRARAGGPVPEPPVNYYAPNVERRLRAQVEAIVAGRESGAPAELMAAPPAVWRERAAIVVANWLQEITARKLSASGAARARAGG